uniref:Putative secreted protein n=1 Tax=Ixodes scapularis TaxID=6945 RepID=A0A4D5RD74_IXOSC
MAAATKKRSIGSFNLVIFWASSGYIWARKVKLPILLQCCGVCKTSICTSSLGFGLSGASFFKLARGSFDTKTLENTVLRLTSAWTIVSRAC